MKWHAMAFFLAGAILCRDPAVAQSVTNNVPIVIDWADAIAPTSISFDLPDGEQPFVSGDKLYRGQRSGSGPWLQHFISLHYPGFSLPLELRTWHESTALRLSGQLWQVGCDKDDFRRIQRVGMSSSYREIVGAIIAARYIFRMSDSACPADETRKMGQVYFNLSCNFAKKVDFFVLSDDAKDAYRKSRPDGGNEAEACAVQSQGVALRELNEAHKAATENHDWALADKYTNELRGLLEDEQWSQAFAVVGVDRTSIDALAFKRTYGRTLEASQTGDYAKALSLNRKLQAAFAIEDNQAAFRAVKIDGTLLETDARFFEARIAADTSWN
ncbi:hypothetical protein E2A64_07655 [Pseudohoeflea suaedae]|uniref:Tetratricopeptide repeat protein n=1 Tax=Pseudohoeflea suaedae TaxID=877384 RepID=A0A4V3A7J4_9HYPH|nr:hypothetical protein [Pseudohoeflea suaedae]TDH38955.1 hypothetical protein E2A64_07655 [Pseudohoeflea suaedae]